MAPGKHRVKLVPLTQARPSTVCTYEDDEFLLLPLQRNARLAHDENLAGPSGVDHGEPSERSRGFPIDRSGSRGILIKGLPGVPGASLIGG